MTKPKGYKRYSSEFKREAIRRASEEGITDAAVCAELGISTRQVRPRVIHSPTRSGLKRPVPELRLPKPGLEEIPGLWTWPPEHP